MTFQKLLLKLSHNKDIAVQCYIADEKCRITIKEFFSFKLLKEVELDLNVKTVDGTEFSSFIR